MEQTVEKTTPTAQKRAIAMLALVLGVLAVALVVLPGPAYRLHLLALSSAFSLLSWGAWTGLAAVVVGAIGAWLARPGQIRPGFGLALFALVLGAIAFGIPFALLQKAHRVPPIHDISTDTETPPTFTAILPLRKDAANPAEYGGADIARLQHQAYPDIRPAIVTLAVPQAYARALQVAQTMGWRIVATAPESGRIEATDTTLWFGFKDDIVIRVSAQGNASRVDIRSVSRIGRSDIGKNAQRIREFLQRLPSG
ncbi:MAG: DUF1499 domain-containing protein [Propionivibrio sp.]